MFPQLAEGSRGGERANRLRTDPQESNLPARLAFAALQTPAAAADAGGKLTQTFINDPRARRRPCRGGLGGLRLQFGRADHDPDRSDSRRGSGSAPALRTPAALPATSPSKRLIYSPNPSDERTTIIAANSAAPSRQALPPVLGLKRGV